VPKRQRAKRKRIIISSDGSTARAPKPKVRLPVAFKILDEVISAAMAASRSAHADEPFEQFQIGIFQRAFNSLKAINVLVENGHWEGATSLSRQLMELALSMEFIFIRSVNPEAEALKFVRYGLLQQALYVRSRSRYEEKIGRLTPASARDITDEALAAEYAEFKAGVNKDNGSVRWTSSWCGKSTYRLAQESPNPARVDQYELLYRAWSEQVHGAPGALMASVFSVDRPDWLVAMLHEDDKRIAETIGNSVNLFSELWVTLPNMRSSFAVEKAHSWLRQLQEVQVGAWLEQ
jgi:hypothetical protein